MLPFGGQALGIMLAHVLLTGLGSRSMTVNQLLAEDPDVDLLAARLELASLAVMLTLALCFWLLGRRRAFRRTVLVYLSIAVLSLLMDCISLVSTLGERTMGTGGAFQLMWDAGLTWSANVLTFAIWYWFLDQGGPDRRGRGEPERPDFAFPQQTGEFPGWERWAPQPLDYLFVAFNTSTAFSPTDTLVLSHRAKVLNMLQALVSLVIVAMLAARVVNMIQ